MKKIVGIMILTFLFLLSGCNLQQPDQVMRPPGLPIEEEEIRGLLKQILPTNAKLISPLRGEDSVPIRFVDLNQDQQDEVLVFYKEEDAISPVWLLVLEREQEDWVKRDEIQGVSNRIDQVQLVDLTGDQQPEVLVGWQVNGGGSLDKGISIYQYKSSQLNEIFKDSYTELVVADLVQSSGEEVSQRYELILIRLDRYQLEAEAELLAWQQGQWIKLGTAEIDGAINGYVAVQAGLARADQMGVFLDEALGAHSGNTELLVYDSEQGLVSVLANGDSSADKAFKAYIEFSQDIDDDGIVEIAHLRPSIGYEKASMAGTIWIRSWYEWNGQQGLEFDRESYSKYSWDEGFSLLFPERWNQQIRVDASEYGAEDEWVRFSYVDSETEETDLLFTIAIFEPAEWEVKKTEGYQKITKNLMKIYAVQFSEMQLDETSQVMQMDLAEIRSNFKLIYRE